MSAQSLQGPGIPAVVPGPRRSWAVALLIVLSLPVALYGLAFAFAPDANPEFYHRLMTLPWYAHAHFLGSGVALLTGGFQFSARLRGTWPHVHRWLGRIYLSSVLVGGLGGLGLAMISHGGPPTHVAFTLLAVIWLYSGAQAYRAIRAGDVAGHRRWMIRNFALTFAAVTLRLQLGFFAAGLGWSFDDAYVTAAWFSWVPNLLVAEWWLLARGRVVSEPAPPRTAAGIAAD